MSCMCGDSECPSCGLAQGTYTGGKTDEVAAILAQRDEAVALLRRLTMSGSTAMVSVFLKDDIDAFLFRLDSKGEA